MTGAPRRTGPLRPESRWIVGSVLVLGLLSLVLLELTRWTDRQLIRRDDALARRLGEILLAITTTHLWVEEYVTGDEVDPEEIARNLREAERSILGFLEPRVDPEFGPLTDARLRERAEEIRDGIVAFRRISEQRQAGHARGEDVGVGSPIDVAYDALFAELFSESTALQQAIETRQGVHRRRAELLFGAIVVTWMAIVAIAVVALVSLQRRQAAAERALRDSRERLLQARKMEALGRMAGGIAHDINNYLGAIRGHGELLEVDEPTRERVRGKVEAIVRVVDKASALIEQLLAFTRQQPVRPQVLRLDATLEDGVLALGRRLLGPDYVLDVRLEDDLWPVRLDPSQLDQVVLNLLVNARDAMPSGGTIVVAVENRTLQPGDPLAARVAAPGDHVALSIEDRGTGITAENLDRIFDPFFSTKGRSGGTGLGLSTVFGILEQAGGGIAVDSTPGEGSRFTVLLPRASGEGAPAADAARPVAEQRPAAAGGARCGPALGRGRTALLVDDHAELRSSTRAMLETLGWRVREAESGEQALAVVAEEQALDLLVTDVAMSGMDGRELAERVRRIRAGVPVLFISGYAEDPSLRAAASAGDLELLRKPFSRAEFTDRVESLLRAEPRT